MSKPSRDRALPRSPSGPSGSPGPADGSAPAAPAAPAEDEEAAEGPAARRASGLHGGPDGTRPGGIDPADVETAETMLAEGRMTVEGRLVTASNATLYCSLEWEGYTAACVYKPVAGERPLWDFPDGT